MGQDNPRAVPVVQAVDLTPVPYRDLKNPYDGDPQAIAAGRQLFKTYCAACHGDRADGKGATIRVAGTPVDFTDQLQISFMTDGYAFWRIKESGQVLLKSQMPAYKEHFSDTQIWQLVTYLKALGPKDTWGMDWLLAQHDELQRNRMIFTAKNCTACHALNGLGGTAAPDLATMPLKHDEAWQTEHFKQPIQALPTFDMVPPRETSTADIAALRSFLHHFREEAAAKSAGSGGLE